MEKLFTFIIICLLILIFLVIYLLFKISKKSDIRQSLPVELLKSQIDRLNQDLNIRLKEQNQTINEQLSKSNNSLTQQFSISQQSIRSANDSTNKIIKDVTEKLTKLDETNNQVVAFASQLQSLEDILKNPKQRGVLGEYFLENVLKNVMPPGSFEMQYKFGNGEIVDAAVFVKDKIIPIDSKFSLENYNKLIEEKNLIEKDKFEKLFKLDLRNRIEETSKYIRPNEKTMDFAFMFIPSEAIYYDLLVNKIGTSKSNNIDLVSYAFIEKKVIIVSPTSFLAYLQTVLQGLRSLQIEESAQKIINQVQDLKKHLDLFEDNFDKVGKYLGTTVNTYNASYKNFKSIDKDVYKLTGEAMEIQASEVDKPLSLMD